jgi:hypothetical protein
MGMAGADWKMRDGCRVRAKTAPVAAVSAPPVFFGVDTGDRAATASLPAFSPILYGLKE